MAELLFDIYRLFFQTPNEQMNAMFVTIKVSAPRASMSRWHLAGQCAGIVGGVV